MGYLREDNPIRKTLARTFGKDKFISKGKIKELMELVNTIPLKIAYKKEKFEGLAEFNRRLKRIEEGKDYDFRLSFYLNMIELLGYEMKLVPKIEPVYSYINKNGYIVIEKSYLPYCKLIINPDNYKDFSMVTGLANYNYYSVYVCYRTLYLWYYKKKVTSRMRYHILRRIKEELSRGDSSVIINIPGEEGRYRGKRD